VEITLLDGDSFRGTLLDWCGCGPILGVTLSASESAKRVVSWDVVKYLDLRE
jgi:hypothetical protein